MKEGLKRASALRKGSSSRVIALKAMKKEGT